VGIEHPFGQIMGRQGDKERQLAVLTAAVDAIEEMDTPGSVKYLQGKWNGTRKESIQGPKEPPPIATYLKWHPWELPRLFSRNVSTNETT
jgi:hypothetical protein